MIEYQIETRDKLDEEVNNFYKKIRQRAMIQPNPISGVLSIDSKIFTLNLNSERL